MREKLNLFKEKKANIVEELTFAIDSNKQYAGKAIKVCFVRKNAIAKQLNR
ncbi:hypothetical protein GCM10008111_05850 [Alishewanella tabrizica]|uniref:Uncharacterized protein n=1 Tax=Alishewanella tabrizica TaxID=671278 RepID=A0ABQ2WH09_9ALTE|nr:hypothetical protein GCM10008111_05850 [Alishewanella tabrizica]